MKYGKCKKCGNETYLEEHHIIPFKKEYKDNRTIDICPNCHTEIHNLLPTTKQSKSFYESFFLSWIFDLFNSKNKNKFEA